MKNNLIKNVLVLSQFLITSFAHADTVKTFSAYLQVDYVTCGRDLQIQARYYDENRDLVSLPLFVQYSSNPEYPFAFDIPEGTCSRLVPKLNSLRGRLVPIQIRMTTYQSQTSGQHPCIIRHPKGDYEGTCRGTPTTRNSYFIQYKLDDLLFTSYGQNL